MSQPLVLPEVVASMLTSFAPVFTKPSFDTFCHYVGALMLGEGRRTRPPSPWRFQLWCQRLALLADTPSRRATSACETLAVNSRAALSRRCSRAARSRHALPRRGGLLWLAVIHLTGSLASG